MLMYTRMALASCRGTVMATTFLARLHVRLLHKKIRSPLMSGRLQELRISSDKMQARRLLPWFAETRCS